MEINYSKLKKKSVINVIDGKDLGKIEDAVLSFPDGKIKAIIVPGKKNGMFCSTELIIGFNCIDKIGDDTILVHLCEKPKEANSQNDETSSLGEEE